MCVCVYAYTHTTCAFVSDMDKYFRLIQMHGISNVKMEVDYFRFLIDIVIDLIFYGLPLICSN